MWRLYRQIYSIGVQNTLVYRWNFLLRAMLGFLPLVGGIFLWRAVMPGEQEMHGYDFSAIVAYFVLMIVLDAMTAPTEDDFQIASDIRDGRINQVLLKPLNYLLYRLTLFCASRTIYSLVALVPISVGVWFLRGYLVDVPWTKTGLAALLATAGSALLQFLMAYTVAMLAFWLLEIGSVVFIVYSVEFLAGGHVFPIDLLPGSLSALCRALPFAYEYWFPVAILLGRLQGPELLAGFAWQAAWIVFFWLFSRCLWQRGLTRYTAVGG